MASALHGDGSADVWGAVEAHLQHLNDQDLRTVRRRHRIRTEVRARLEQAMARAAEAAMNSPRGAEWLDQAERTEIAPTHATNQLLDVLLSKPEEQ
jgi:putative protein kinase ArgK-like GTPase of G3E family